MLLLRETVKKKNTVHHEGSIYYGTHNKGIARRISNARIEVLGGRDIFNRSK